VAHYDQFENFEQTKRPSACTLCETMLPEAVDGTLTATEQRIFDAHIAGCTACSAELAEAQRGAAWLGMLKSAPPEPPVHLLAKILAETSEAMPAHAAILAPQPAPSFAARLLALGRSLTSAFSMEHAQSVFQPRLAMTAAMAFFSIALTLNLTGVHLRDLRAEDFTPAGLQRSFADTTASVERSFQNDRTVYQVESRLSEMNQNDAPPSQEGEPSR